MNITPRLKKIIIILLEEENSIAVKELAQQIGVSKRTVQRELEYIGNELDEYHITFETKTGKGVWLSGTDEDKKRLLNELKGEDTYDVSNREERRKRLILELLKDKGLKKLYYYASRFQVSEATISADLEAVEGWLNAHRLTITRKPGSGVEVNGSENDYRLAIRTFIEENIDTKLLRDAYEIENTASFKNIYGNGIGEIINEDILKRVENCISAMESKRIINLTENSYAGLVLHIAVAISRILKDEIVEQGAGWKETPPMDEDYQLAQQIVKQLEQTFSIEIPEIETKYICLHIKGSKHQSIEWNGQKTVEIERRELLTLISDMINAYDEKNAYAIKQDNEFIQGLLAHLQPTIIRLMYDMKISNPILEDIKKAYPGIFEQSKKAAAILEKWVHKPIPQEEIGFLAIHFGAAQVRFEGNRENIRQVSIGIVCASGIGISRLMYSKLNKLFRERIHIETYGKNDITPYIISKTDFFVSSITLHLPDADIIPVNPLLTETDLEKIRQHIYHYERLPQNNSTNSLFQVQLEQITTVVTQIKTILRYLEVIKVSNEITFGEIITAISEKMSPYSDRQLMIQEAIEEREKLSSQVFAELGFALLHTRTNGVTRPSFSIWTTKDRKAFHDPYFRGINVVLVMLLPIDDNIKINSEILGYISSSLIDDYDFLTTITEGEKPDIESALSKQLRKFFNQYLNRLQQK